MWPCQANQREIWASGTAAVTSYVSLSSVKKAMSIEHRSRPVSLR
jgi:hypothetical protein